MSWLERVHTANRCDLGRFWPWLVERRRIGFVRPDFANELRGWPAVFSVARGRVSLSAALESAHASERTEALVPVIDRLRAAGHFGDQWWGEHHAVDAGPGTPVVLRLERAALQRFGVTGYGVHLNGYVRQDNELKMWVARRSASKASAPGKLDQLVAGGQPAGIGLHANVIKECAEEAGMAPELAAKARPVGAVSYCLETEFGVRPDILYIYDLELPVDFEPVNTDGEVDAFFLWPVAEVAEIVATGERFKFNCALVVIDFLIRHGLIDPEDSDYLALQAGLRQREIALAQVPW